MVCRDDRGGDAAAELTISTGLHLSDVYSGVLDLVLEEEFSTADSIKLAKALASAEGKADPEVKAVVPRLKFELHSGYFQRMLAKLDRKSEATRILEEAGEDLDREEQTRKKAAKAQRREARMRQMQAKEEAQAAILRKKREVEEERKTRQKEAETTAETSVPASEGTATTPLTTSATETVAGTGGVNTVSVTENPVGPNSASTPVVQDVQGEIADVDNSLADGNVSLSSELFQGGLGVQMGWDGGEIDEDASSLANSDPLSLGTDLSEPANMSTSR
jgi:hypothetical protein